MGLFDRRSPEEKAFDKAFKDIFGGLMNTFSSKKIAALEEASANCPERWEGPLLLGLCNDCAVGDAGYHPDVAQQWFEKARTAAKGDEFRFVEEFFSYYRRDSQLYGVPLTPQLLNIRSAGVAAAATCGREGRSFLNSSQWFLFFNWVNAPDCGSSGEETGLASKIKDTISNMFVNWGSYDENQVSKSIKKGNKALDVRKSDLQESPEEYIYADIYLLLFGMFHLFSDQGGIRRELVEEHYRRHDESMKDAGYAYIFCAAKLGNHTAIELCTELYFADKDCRRYLIQMVGSEEDALKNLRVCIEFYRKGNQGGYERLMSKYFS